MSYHRYWSREILKSLSQVTAIKEDDILETMKLLGLEQFMNPERRIVASDTDVLNHLLTESGSEGLKVDVSKLRLRYKG
ncbi:hypothetical protein MKW98_017430 [Papaver atlanticum]|uniref:Histone acetyltransferase n=1 Tax=Papaver atlanticum TaxID=357466 RepID=A0AAD4XHY7_9MAGN|nr:hypothetical protein MKW98_017430 [Papaver atlanticum]